MISISRQAWKNFLKDTRGEAGFVEWFIIVVCVALFCMVAFKALGTSITTEANAIGGAITGIGTN
jgi:Flp pilus assembly pilin Flp